jgi:hypothetical protein
MSPASSPGSPRLARGGIVLLDPVSSRIMRVIALQYNPDGMSRTLQPQGVGQEAGDRLEALRLTGPPHETLTLDEVELDATEQLESPREHDDVAKFGLLPVLAALETIVYPRTDQLLANDASARQGAIEVKPTEAPLSLFVWSRNRILPVRITEFSITEEAFDSSLNPIRARVRLGMRVLTVNDLGFQHRGGSLFLLYQRQKERFAAMNRSPDLGTLGITGIPGG